MFTAETAVSVSTNFRTLKRALVTASWLPSSASALLAVHPSVAFRQPTCFFAVPDVRDCREASGARVPGGLPERKRPVPVACTHLYGVQKFCAGFHQLRR